MGEKLARPTLQEAICEFRYVRSPSWGESLPGLFFDALKDAYPSRQEVKTFQASVRMSAAVDPDVRRTEGPSESHFVNTDQSAMLQLGEWRMSVHSLSRYSSWEEFRGRILEAWSKLSGLVPEAKVERVGLRYVNRIAIEESRSMTEDYLTVNPPLAGDLARPLRSFYQRYEMAFDDPLGSLVHQTGTSGNHDSRFIMLDLDYISPADSNRFASVPGEMINWLDKVHDTIEGVFIGSLNPKYYNSLKV